MPELYADAGSIAPRAGTGDTGRMTAPDGPLGGRATISGILYQMLPSLAVGCTVVAQVVRDNAHRTEATLVLEPAVGGDLQRGDGTLVEQIKIRRGEAPWSAGEVAEDVLPDLHEARREFRDEIIRRDGGRPSDFLYAFRGVDFYRSGLAQPELLAGDFLQRVTITAPIPGRPVEFSVEVGENPTEVTVVGKYALEAEWANWEVIQFVRRGRRRDP